MLSQITEVQMWGRGLIGSEMEHLSCKQRATGSIPVQGTKIIHLMVPLERLALYTLCQETEDPAYVLKDFIGSEAKWSVK